MELPATPLWMSRLGAGADSDQPFDTILERAIAGDVSAFEQIVVRHERRVLTLAWRLLGNSADAQDASQEVFLRAFRFLRRFDPRRPIEPWLVRITVNVCRDCAKRTRQQPGGIAESREPICANDPHDDLQAQEQKLRLQQALQQLPEKERAAVVLRDIEGLSTAEVAQVLGSSETTVRVQISNARLKMRKLLKRR
jgi:RNA polymerase sigma-70 factor (ECF subfamily)